MLREKLKTGGTIELESPYSRITKIVTRKLLQQKGHPLNKNNHQAI